MRLFFLTAPRTPSDSCSLALLCRTSLRSKGEIEVSLDNVTSIGTEGSVILFPPKCVHSIALAKGSVPVQYDVIKFDPNLLPTCKTDELDLRRILHGIHAYRCPCIFSPEQVRKMDLFPLFSDILKEYRDKELGYSMILNSGSSENHQPVLYGIGRKSGTSFRLRRASFLRNQF